MLARTASCTLSGIEARVVDVEVDISYGLPVFNMVGLPEAAVKESRERVRAAVKNSGYTFPMDRITVNFAPADIRKEGTGFDLPVALGILTASGLISQTAMAGYLILGELSLDGEVKAVNGVLSAALTAGQNGCRGIIVPKDNGPEAAAVRGLKVYAVDSLSRVVDLFTGQADMDPCTITERSSMEILKSDVDFSEVQGQNHAKRALEVAAAGGHNLIMSGPPGSGKSMLAKRFPTILPPLTFEESVETTRIYSVAGRLRDASGLMGRRPFRAPHHTVSAAGLVGGGLNPQPGEVSLAHNGVLFLDELPEFKRNTLEVLRQPMEEGRVTLARAGNQVSYPALFMLVAAMNPCPCGNFGNPAKECTCTRSQIQRYCARISGPLLDRMDIQVDVPQVPFRDLAGTAPVESSECIRNRVEAARNIQAQRFKESPLLVNAGMTGGLIQTHCRLNMDGRNLLEAAVDRLGFSARAYTRVLKIARTVADLAQSRDILREHLAEAVQYRMPDRDGTD